jgi:hypothetical protein
MKTVWPKKHKNATCQSIWGSDPYPVSPDLGPHARFVIPQCRKLILGKKVDIILAVSN